MNMDEKMKTMIVLLAVLKTKVPFGILGCALYIFYENSCPKRTICVHVTGNLYSYFVPDFTLQESKINCLTIYVAINVTDAY